MSSAISFAANPTSFSRLTSLKTPRESTNQTLRPSSDMRTPTQPAVDGQNSEIIALSRFKTTPRASEQAARNAPFCVIV